ICFDIVTLYIISSPHPAPTDTYTLSLHDALPIFIANDHAEMARRVEVQGVHVGQDDDSIKKVRSQIKRPIVVGKSTHSIEQAVRSEEHTSELQSPYDLVCRLLLEKKMYKSRTI